MTLPVAPRAVAKVVGPPAVDFVVLGGGLSGLSAAFYLRRFIRKDRKEPKVNISLLVSLHCTVWCIARPVGVALTHLSSLNPQRDPIAADND